MKPRYVLIIAALVGLGCRFLILRLPFLSSFLIDDGNWSDFFKFGFDFVRLTDHNDDQSLPMDQFLRYGSDLISGCLGYVAEEKFLVVGG